MFGRATPVVRWCLALAMGTTPLAGQGTGAFPGRQVQPPAYRIALVTGPVRFDAKGTDPAWEAADSIVDLRQREPDEGAPATERTVVKLLRDAGRLHILVRAYDTDVKGIRSTQLRRDADLSTDDNITILIDSYRDRHGAFVFRVNPGGAKWDAQLTGFDNVNEDWDGIWDVTVRRDSVSWSAQFVIPLQTLRFRPGNELVGMNIRRFIRRKNEEDLWRSWGRAQGINNLLNTADVSGFAGVRGGRRVELRPYLLGRLVATSFDDQGVPVAPSDAGAKAGLDAKMAVSPTITADLTVNTDFAQVEADQQVINLTRFPTFFPEKREFFLESSGLFDLGTPGQTQLFYSRRIGLDTSGTPVPMVAGARVYGKMGRWGIGALDVRTGGDEQANDLALRVSHDLLDRSSVVAMVVDRTRPGVPAERGAGIDVDFPLVTHGRNLEPHFWLMGTRTGAAAGTPVAWRLSTDAPNDRFDAFAALYSIDSGFNPTMGFTRRTGIWETTGHIDLQPRPRHSAIRQLDLTPIPSWDIITDRRGNLLDPSSWQTADLEWHLFAGDLQSGDQFELNIRRDLDAPTEAFEIFRGRTVAPGRYWWTSGELQYETSPGRPVSGQARVSSGQFYDGHSTTVELSGTIRAGGHLILASTYAVTSAHLSSGDFTARQASGRIEYAFNPRTDFLGFVQYQNDDDRIDFNLRFHWIPRTGDDVFVVWNSGYTTDPTARWRFPDRLALSHPLNGALLVKAVHRFTP